MKVVLELNLAFDNQNGNYWPTGEINFIGRNHDNDEGHGGFQFKVTNNNNSGNNETSASANTTAMVMDYNGNIGIGITNPDQKLHIKGTGSTYNKTQSGHSDGNYIQLGAVSK